MDEYKRLLRLLMAIPVNRRKAADGLIKEAAELRGILEKLRDEMEVKGLVQDYQSGSNTYARVNPALKTYNTCLGNYTKVITALIRLLPEHEKDTADDIRAWM